MTGGDEWVCVRMGDGFESARVTSINVASAFVHFSSFVIHLRREKRTTTSLLFIRVRYILWKAVYLSIFIQHVFDNANYKDAFYSSIRILSLLLLLHDILDYICDWIPFSPSSFSSMRSHVYRD